VGVAYSYKYQESKGAIKMITSEYIANLEMDKEAEARRKEEQKQLFNERKPVDLRDKKPAKPFSWTIV
jgi:hypothetical protein